MYRSNTLPRLVCLWAVVSFGMVHGTAVNASEVLRPSLAKIAAAVAKIAQTRGGDSVVIGQFTGPPNFGSNAGPGIQQVLTDELKTLGVKVKKFGAALGVRGEYLYTSAEAAANSNFKQIRLKVVLTDGSGQPLTSLNRDVNLDGDNGSDANFPINPDPGFRPDGDKLVIRGGEINLDTFTGGEEAAALLGVTWDFERSGLGFDVSKDIVVESFERPTAHIVGGTAVRSSPKSPYFVEIFRGNRPLPLRLEDGQPVVDLSHGDSFSIRVTNRAAHDISANLTLDGVSSFAFSKVRRPDGSRLTRYVVEENRPLLIKGWHDTLTTTTQFKVTDFSQSAAALVGSESGLGMITVLIRGSWTFNESAPSDEPGQNVVGSYLGAAPTVGSAGGTFGSQPNAIGFGDKVQQGSHVATNRQTGVVRSIITIRYDKPPTPSPGESNVIESSK